jgi:hypothetical protein
MDNKEIAKLLDQAILHYEDMFGKEILHREKLNGRLCTEAVFLEVTGTTWDEDHCALCQAFPCSCLSIDGKDCPIKVHCGGCGETPYYGVAFSHSWATWRHWVRAEIHFLTILRDLYLTRANFPA